MTIEELESIRNNKRQELDLRVNSNAPGVERHILVCHGTGCTSSKSPQILEEFNRIIKDDWLFRTLFKRTNRNYQT